MKKAFVFILFYVTTFSVFGAVGADSIQAVAVLTRMQGQIRQLQNLSYESEFRQVNPELADSIYAIEGKVWLKTNPSDSIFGCTLHISSNDSKNGAYDYYYDGERSYAISHGDKQIAVIYPQSFANNDNNPAKRMLAVEPLQPLLYDRSLVHTLLSDRPQIQLQDGGEGWIVRLTYPPNAYGAIFVNELTIDKKTYRLKQLFRKVFYNGTIYKTTYTIHNLQENADATNDSISLTTFPKEYTISEVRKSEKKADTTALSFLGKRAGDFTYYTIDKKLLTLTNIKARYLLLDFWETWCGYCIMALPKLEKLYKEKHDKGLEIVGIVTENITQIKQMVQRNGIPYPIVIGDEKILSHYKVSGRPTYVLIDQQGVIQAYSTGDLDSVIGAIKW